MAPQTRRRIATAELDRTFGYAPTSAAASSLVWDAPGRHANFRSTIYRRPRLGRPAAPVSSGGSEGIFPFPIARIIFSICLRA
jgi:hypothetical protein